MDEITDSVITEEGNCVFENKEAFGLAPLLIDVATQLVVLSSMSHGLTSVCDNHANAIIKNQWKSEHCGENELLDSIYLLWCTGL